MKLLNALPQTIEECEDLESISFDSRVEHDITDDDLAKVVPYCFDLKEAYLGGIHDLSDRTLILLGEHTDDLKVLDISGCQFVGPLGIRELVARATKLQTLRMGSVWTVTDPAVTNVVRTLGHLAELDLSDLPLVTSHSVREVWTFCRQLRMLKVSRCKNLTDRAFPSPLPTESTFQLGGSKGVVVPSVPGTSQLPPKPSPSPGKTSSATAWTNNLPPLVLPSHQTLQHLQFLDVSQCTKLTDDAVVGLVLHAPRINELSMSGCTQMTNKTLQSLTRLSDHLLSLDVSHCPYFTDDGINKLVRSCPRIKFMNISRKCSF
jgi:F-box and leucine-rich repeat protein GRR1